jgi:hypothetical protein
MDNCYFNCVGACPDSSRFSLNIDFNFFSTVTAAAITMKTALQMAETVDQCRDSFSQNLSIFLSGKPNCFHFSHRWRPKWWNELHSWWVESKGYCKILSSTTASATRHPRFGNVSLSMLLTTCNINRYSSRIIILCIKSNGVIHFPISLLVLYQQAKTFPISQMEIPLRRRLHLQLEFLSRV